MTGADGATTTGWLFVHPDLVPERWRARVRPLALVPLLPDETRDLLATGRITDTAIGDLGEDFVQLVAAGTSRENIVRALGLSMRTVDRRFARLREHLGVDSRAEVAAELVRRGW
jgi:DNA-binding CsgD family transcriptional regulator